MHMKDRSLAPGSHEAALFAHGFWAVAGFVGSSVLATGVAARFEGSALQTALYVVAGAALATVSWYRAGAALDRVDAPALQVAQ